MKFRVVTAARGIFCCALAFVVSANATVIVQLKVVEGEGVVYRTGTRATRGLTVLVTDETGKPVDMAAVSFRLPDEGASGTFGSGLRSEIVTTGPDGRATVWGMQWNKTPGGFEIKVTASKGQARAGVAVTQYLRDSVKAAAGGEGTFTASHHSRTKWLIIAAAIGGGAAAGIGLRGSSKAAAPAPTTTPTSIGNPTILVGHP